MATPPATLLKLETLSEPAWDDGLAGIGAGPGESERAGAGAGQAAGVADGSADHGGSGRRDGEQESAVIQVAADDQRAEIEARDRRRDGEGNSRVDRIGSRGGGVAQSCGTDVEFETVAAERVAGIGELNRAERGSCGDVVEAGGLAGGAGQSENQRVADPRSYAADPNLRRSTSYHRRGWRRSR